MAYAKQQLDLATVAPVMVDTSGIAVYENIVELHTFDAALKLAMLKSNSILFNSATPPVTV